MTAVVLALASPAAAGTISIAWDPSPEPTVVGYIVYVGTAAGNYTASYDVGNVTTFDLTTAVPGTTYHLAVKAYASATIVSPMSADLSVTMLGTPPAPTPLSPTGTATSATPTFSWTAVSSAASYFLSVNDAQQTGKIRQVYSAAAAGCGAGSGNCSIAPGITLAAGSANWSVLASNAAGDGPWSAATAFTVPAATGGGSTGGGSTGGTTTGLNAVPQTGWRLRFVDSQETAAANNAAANAFDGDPNTMWATQWQAASPLPPHEIQIDLGQTYALGGFRYLPRQDGVTYGDIARFEFYVSADGTAWGTPVATGTFANAPGVEQVLFPTTNARYIRLRALSEVSGYPWSVAAEINVLAVTTTSTTSSPVLPRTGWKLRFADSQETTAANDAATNAFDGNPATMWATQWQAASPPPPHEIQIDLGGTYSLTGFRYLPRQDGQPYGRIANYEFYVSTDGTTWGTAVASGTFANSGTEKEVGFAAKSARYVRLRALSEVSGYAWTTVAELNVLGSGNQPPDSTITSPATDLTIRPGQSVSFAGTGSDPENNTPLTYAWSFGAGGPAASTNQNPGSVTFPTAGVYSVTFTVKDSTGRVDPTPATRTITVQSATTTPTTSLIPQGGWKLRFADSQETAAANNAAVNAFDGNPATMWATQWQTAAPPPPHEIQIDLGASYSVSGFRYLPRQDGEPWGRIATYEFYVSSDGVNWGAPVASGAFPNSGVEQQVSFAVKAGRYVRLRALSEVGGYPWTTISELRVVQTVP